MSTQHLEPVASRLASGQQRFSHTHMTTNVRQALRTGSTQRTSAPPRVIAPDELVTLKTRVECAGTNTCSQLLLQTLHVRALACSPQTSKSPSPSSRPHRWFPERFQTFTTFPRLPTVVNARDTNTSPSKWRKDSKHHQEQKQEQQRVLSTRTQHIPENEIKGRNEETA